MASLTYKEKLIFEELFDMGSGFVLDFSNATFARFIVETINIDIYEGLGYEKYSSKANKLRQIWSKESDSVVGILMDELLTYYEDLYSRREQELSEHEIKKRA
jgi:hypothetical protein